MDKKWTEEEDAVLMEGWPKGGYHGVRDKLPQRTEWAIRGRAIHTGIRYIDKSFWGYVDKTETCWIWTGAKVKGYGQFRERESKKLKQAHRISYEIAHGRIPDGLCVLHKCDNPPCVNPAHLWLGTRGDNNRDMCLKKRQAKGEANGFAKVTEQEVRAIRARNLSGESCRQIARVWGISRSQLRRILNGESWSHI